MEAELNMVASFSGYAEISVRDENVSYKQKWHHLLSGFTLISGKSQVHFFSSLGIKHIH